VVNSILPLLLVTGYPRYFSVVYQGRQPAARGNRAAAPWSTRNCLKVVHSDVNYLKVMQSVRNCLTLAIVFQRVSRWSPTIFRWSAIGASSGQGFREYKRYKRQKGPGDLNPRPLAL